MKIGSTVYFKPNFRGDYWLTTDVHDKLPMHCGTLNKMTDAIKSSKEKTTLLDNGDSFGYIFRLGATQKVLENFTQINPDTNVVFNMGNLELGALTRKITQENLKSGYANLHPMQQDKLDYIKMMQELKSKNDKIHFVSCFANHLEENCEIPKGLIEPYAIIDDVVDGEEKKVLILGTSIENSNKFTVERQKEELKKVIDEIKAKNEQYDYAILMSHNESDKGENKSFSNVIDFIEENGIKLNFVVGGHMHALYDEQYKGKRILFPPSSGKGALKVALHKNEIYAPKINIGADTHNSSSLQAMKSASVIANSNMTNPLKISKTHENILLEANNDYKKPLTKMPLTLKLKDYSEPLTNTSEVGTFFANTAREITNADFACFLFSDFREAPPKKGETLTPYNIKDVINVDKSVWLTKLSSDEVKELLEIALKDQRNPENGCMLEFSDNIRITRTDNPNGEKVKQIEIKEGDNWVKLLDKDGTVKEEFKDRTFKIATCSQIAQGTRFGFEMMKNRGATAFIDKSGEISNPKFMLQELDPEFQGRVLLSNVLLYGLNQAKEKGIEKIERAEILTV